MTEGKLESKLGRIIRSPRRSGVISRNTLRRAVKKVKERRDKQLFGNSESLDMKE